MTQQFSPAFVKALEAVSSIKTPALCSTPAAGQDEPRALAREKATPFAPTPPEGDGAQERVNSLAREAGREAQGPAPQSGVGGRSEGLRRSSTVAPETD